MARREPSVRLTYADYVDFPDDKRYELIDGEAFVVPSPNRRHQEILGRLHVAVATYLSEHPAGEVFLAPFDVVLSDSDVVQPDIVYVAEADAHVLTDANIRGTPTWVVEILSPSTGRRDRTIKRQAYERAGVPELWLIEPDEDVVHVALLRGDRLEDTITARPPEQLRPEAIGGLAIDLADLLRR